MILYPGTVVSSPQFLSFSTPLSLSTNFTANTPQTGKLSNCNRISFTVKAINPRTKVVRPKRVYEKPLKGKWEEPLEGEDSSDDEEQDDWSEVPDGVEEEDEEERQVSLSVSSGKSFTKDQSDEDFIREVELLLGPEEREILEQNEAPDLTKISSRKWCPLHSLALSSQNYFMDKLLRHGVDIDGIDKDGFTALHKAVIGKKEPVISHLLRKGANPHVRDRDGATPLHYAVQVGAVLTVKLLIKYKVDVNVADDEGWTPLHVAVQARSRDIAKILLVNGADKTRKTKDGKTPLDLSLCYGKDFKSYELAKLLKVMGEN
ncbi:hypothetical protein MKW94_024279 [Papaver nudicaule]|uniref:Ankyrin repeat domain-containing protein EMB506, chloroplastic n=1 Tax=Papaver nudicaule TaxID=74823 RepID=A0AA41V2L4_PAPNU|nr:hypothetical protein [Papaver nudicaule]